LPGGCTHKNERFYLGKVYKSAVKIQKNAVLCEKIIKIKKLRKLKN